MRERLPLIEEQNGFKLLQEARVKGSSFLEKLEQGFKRFKLPQEAKMSGSKGSNLLKRGARPEKVADRPKQMAGRPKTVPVGHH